MVIYIMAVVALVSNLVYRINMAGAAHALIFEMYQAVPSEVQILVLAVLALIVSDYGPLFSQYLFVGYLLFKMWAYSPYQSVSNKYRSCLNLRRRSGLEIL